MPARTKEQLKSYFKIGSRPTAGHYSDLIDSVFNVVDNEEIGFNPLGRVLFVDNFFSGSPFEDGGERGFISKPYRSLDEAINDSISGDTIVIYPGIEPYRPINMFKPGISYFAYPGVVIKNNISVSPLEPIFSDAAESAGTVKVYGYAEFEEDGATVAELTKALSKIEFKGASIKLNLEEAALVIAANAKLLLESTTIVSTVEDTATDAAIENSGIVRIKDTSMISDAASPARSLGGSGVFEIMGTFSTNMSLKSGTVPMGGTFNYDENYQVF